MNPKVTTKKLNRGIANKLTKGIYWNHRNYSVQKKAAKKKKGWEEQMQQTENKRPNLNPTISIITINVNGLNNLIKMQRNVRLNLRKIWESWAYRSGGIAREKPDEEEEKGAEEKAVSKEHTGTTLRRPFALHNNSLIIKCLQGQ